MCGLCVAQILEDFLCRVFPCLLWQIWSVGTGMDVALVLANTTPLSPYFLISLSSFQGAKRERNPEPLARQAGLGNYFKTLLRPDCMALTIHLGFCGVRDHKLGFEVPTVLVGLWFVAVFWSCRGLLPFVLPPPNWAMGEVQEQVVEGR